MKLLRSKIELPITTYYVFRIIGPGIYQVAWCEKEKDNESPHDAMIRLGFRDDLSYGYYGQIEITRVPFPSYSNYGAVTKYDVIQVYHYHSPTLVASIVSVLEGDVRYFPKITMYSHKKFMRYLLKLKKKKRFVLRKHETT